MIIIFDEHGNVLGYARTFGQLDLLIGACSRSDTEFTVQPTTFSLRSNDR